MLNESLRSLEFMELFRLTENAQIIDVRSVNEFNSGHIIGAKNIPAEKKEELLNLDKSKTYFIYCNSGGICALVTHLLCIHGFEKLHYLNDNINDVLVFWQSRVLEENF